METVKKQNKQKSGCDSVCAAPTKLEKVQIVP